jgi:hypothetical protein
MSLLKDIVVYYTIKNLLKEYEVFCEVKQNKQLPTYKELESKLLKKELLLSSKENENQGVQPLVA